MACHYPHYPDVEHRLSKFVCETILETVDCATINSQNLSDIATELGERVSGNHIRRIKDEHKPADRAEMKCILRDWFSESMCDMDRQTALKRLIEIFESRNVDQRPLAKKIKAYLHDSVMDTEDNIQGATRQYGRPTGAKKKVKATPRRETWLEDKLAKGGKKLRDVRNKLKNAQNALRESTRKNAELEEMVRGMSIRANFQVHHLSI